MRCRPAPSAAARLYWPTASNFVRRVLGPAGIAGIGLGVPEFVSLEGAITSAALWDWRDSSWRSVLERIAPVVAVPDVRAAAVAEARFGADRGRGSFLYVSVGTGISLAFVIDRVVWQGARGNATVMGAPRSRNGRAEPRCERGQASPG